VTTHYLPTYSMNHLLSEEHLQCHGIPCPSLVRLYRYHGGGTVYAAAVDTRFLVSKQVDSRTPHAFLEDGTVDYYGIAGGELFVSHHHIVYHIPMGPRLVSQR